MPLIEPGSHSSHCEAPVSLLVEEPAVQSEQLPVPSFSANFPIMIILLVLVSHLPSYKRYYQFRTEILEAQCTWFTILTTSNRDIDTYTAIYLIEVIIA